MNLRQLTDEAVDECRMAWNNAPGIVRSQAGQFVEPMLAALEAMNAELNAQVDTTSSNG
jgi:hypothetical protein